MPQRKAAFAVTYDAEAVRQLLAQLGHFDDAQVEFHGQFAAVTGLAHVHETLAGNGVHPAAPPQDSVEL